MKEARMYPHLAQRQAARTEKVRKTLKCCWDFLDGHMPDVEFDVREEEVEGKLKCVADWTPTYNVPQIMDGRMLIFCRTRNFSELMANIINKALNKFFEEQFKELSKAYQTLSDKNKRRIYDLTGSTDTDNTFDALGADVVLMTLSLPLPS